MKRNVLLTLAAASLLVLSGCSNLTGYGDFTMVEDPAQAETTYKEVQTLNENVDDVEGYENETTVVGSYTEDGETSDVDMKATTRIGIDNTKYASDTIMESPLGTMSTFERFNETDNKYYTYMGLEFEYVDPDTTKEMSVNLKLRIENSMLNMDVDADCDAAMISANIEDFHMLASMSYSDDMKIYTSSKGYYKVTTTEDDLTQECIFDENGSLVEMKMNSSADGDNVVLTSKISYETTLDTINMEDYEEGSLESSMSFGLFMMTFLTLSLGTFSSLLDY